MQFDIDTSGISGQFSPIKQFEEFQISCSMVILTNDKLCVHIPKLCEITVIELSEVISLKLKPVFSLDLCKLTYKKELTSKSDSVLGNV